MMPTLTGETHLAVVAASALLNSVWQAFILCAGVWLALQLLPEITASVRSRIWLGLLLIVAALPVWFLNTHRAATNSAATNSPAAGLSSARVLHIDARWAVLLVCIWAGSSAWAVVRLLAGARQLRHVTRSARTLEIPAELQDLFGASPANRPVRLCTSSEVAVPSVAGFLHPRILLPVGLIDKLSADDLRQIILHEQEHLHRRDDWTNLLQKVLVALFPLNPVLHWIERRLCLERELACDDGVLSRTGASKAYATCLANLAEHTMLRRGLALALGAWQRQSELARRVHRILRPSRVSVSAGSSLAVASVVGGVCAAGLLLLARAPLPLTFQVGAPAPLVSSVPTHGAPAQPAATGHFQATPVRFTPPARKAEVAVPASRAASNSPAVTVRRSVDRSRSRAFVRSAGAADSSPQMVLIGWRETRQMTSASALYFAPGTARESHFTYAAVPVRNGWLIFQL